MERKWFNQWVDAWSDHADGNEANIEAMVAASTEDVVYDDVNLPNPIVGHEGISGMCKGAQFVMPGMKLDIRRRVLDGDQWALEWLMTGTHAATGKPFECRGATIGTLAPDGRVRTHLDCWNVAQLEAQIGGPLF